MRRHRRSDSMGARDSERPFFRVASRISVPVLQSLFPLSLLSPSLSRLFRRAALALVVGGALAMLAPGPAVAQSAGGEAFVAGGLGAAFVNQPGELVPRGDRQDAAFFQVGYMFNEMLGASLGATYQNSVAFDGTQIFEPDVLVGRGRTWYLDVDARLSFPSRTVQPFVTAGVGLLVVDPDGGLPGLEGTHREFSPLNLGAGLEVRLTERLGALAQYKIHNFGSDVRSLGVVSLGLAYHFSPPLSLP